MRGAMKRKSVTSVMSISMDINGYLEQLGQFGYYQLYVYLLTALPAFVAGMAALQNVFLLGEPDHRCFIPGCDSSNSTFNEPFANVLVDASNPSCSMYKFANFSPTISTVNAISEDRCYGNLTGVSVTCSAYVYSQKDFMSTAVTEWNHVCDLKWYNTASASFFMFGNLFGSLIFGICADRYGRRSVYWWGPLVGGLAALTVAMSPNIVIFTIANFFIAITATGLYMIGFILGVEFIGPKYRVWCANGYQIVFALGEIFLAAVAYNVRYWRQLEYIIAVIIGLLFLLAIFLPESVRWLASKNRNKEAFKIIKRAANWNNIALIVDSDLKTHDYEDLDRNGNATTSRDVDDDKTVKPEQSGMISIMKHPLLRRWSINLYINWSVNALVYYGLSMSASNLGQDLSIYATFMCLAAVEIPFVIGISLIMNRFGRRWPLAMSMITGGVICILPAFVTHGPITIVLAVMGKGCIAASFALVYFYSAEIYPTVLRSAGMGLCSMMARVGGFLAPVVVSVRFLGDETPLIVCGICALIAGIMALDLPETHNKTLPETLDDVYKLKETSKEVTIRV